ncbi:hypothetical protein NQ318_013952 [Aromia moschata]|uniref:Uncharacterized protein n=1 Tax=Aromia moschata TaxID=1265417 RepID=A0AAV8XGI7_9CUCU|nr:hypothetical protein NQ318_013952 [Aromia moschata]
MKLIQTAFKSRIASYRVHSENRYSDYNIFFESIKNKVIHLLSEVIKNNAVKVIMELFGRLKKIVDNKSFNTANKVIDSAADLNDVFYVFVDLMTTQMSEFQKRDSGWELQFIMYVEINLNKFCAFGGSSYIKLPSFIEKKKGIVNVHNQDQCCFLWAIISALHPVRQRTLDVSLYPQFSTVLDIEGMTFPVNLRDISKFELRNNISINVHTLESNFENDKIVYRVVGPLYYSQKKLHICTYQFAANNHIRNISVMGAYYILVMKTYYFNINKMTAIIYIRQYRQEKLKRTNTELTREPYSFAYLIKYSFNDSLSKFELYRGANAANVFVKRLRII